MPSGEINDFQSLELSNKFTPALLLSIVWRLKRSVPLKSDIPPHSAGPSIFSVAVAASGTFYVGASRPALHKSINVPHW